MKLGSQNTVLFLTRNAVTLVSIAIIGVLKVSNYKGLILERDRTDSF